MSSYRACHGQLAGKTSSTLCSSSLPPRRNRDIVNEVAIVCLHLRPLITFPRHERNPASRIIRHRARSLSRKSSCIHPSFRYNFRLLYNLDYIQPLIEQNQPREIPISGQGRKDEKEDAITDRHRSTCHGTNNDRSDEQAEWKRWSLSAHPLHPRQTPPPRLFQYTKAADRRSMTTELDLETGNRARIRVTAWPQSRNSP